MQVPVVIVIAVAVLMAAIGLFLGRLLRKVATSARVQAAEQKAEELIREAQREAEMIKKEATLQAKNLIVEARADFEREAEQRREELLGLEKRLVAREEHLGSKLELLEQKEGELVRKEQAALTLQRSLGEKESSLNRLIEEQRRTLENVAGLSATEAKKILMANIEEDARAEAAKTVRRIEEEAREEAAKKARNVLALAVQRYAADVVSEKTVCVVSLPNEEMKGRIIGREGRNIRAIEAATGMELIIDDTPEAVMLSGFNAVRREIARIALERLIADGRIHPARIEEVVEKVSQEMEDSLRQVGEQAAFDVGIHGLHPELIVLLGKLKYRTSYGQNCLLHSIEVAFMCGVMAAELGINVKQAKRAALLHDIGKAADHEVEGPHALIGADMARKYGESPRIIHAIAAHHEEERPESVLAVLVSAADSLSAARPGARREMYETYIQRLKDLERLASSFKGVTKSYAIHAGREVRVIVEQNQLSDIDAAILAKELARKIESDITYPGQIKVTVIRESRAVEIAH